ncbi:MAG TPA: carbohydrate ABC transporter permease [Gryllotalpicola sp.]
MIETRGFRWLRAIGLTIIGIFVVFPLYVILSTSFKSLGEVSGHFTWFPAQFTLAPFVDIWSTLPLAHYLVNSLITSISSTAVSVVIAVLAAYAIARFRFRGARLFRYVVLSTQMFPGILFLLPLFLLFTQIQNAIGLQLNGSYLGLIITYLTFSLPFAIWMLAGYLESIPRDLEEAALIDGLGPVGALVRVVLPVARPGVIAVAVYSFITAWGEVLFSSVLTTNATRTLAVGLQSYSTQAVVYWNQLMAASIVVSLPVLIGFILVQRHLVAGLAAGSVK